MDLELGGDLHPLGAGDDIAVDGVGDDGLIFAGEVFVQVVDELLNGGVWRGFFGVIFLVCHGYVSRLPFSGAAVGRGFLLTPVGCRGWGGSGLGVVGDWRLCAESNSRFFRGMT